MQKKKNLCFKPRMVIGILITKFLNSASELSVVIGMQYSYNGVKQRCHSHKSSNQSISKRGCKKCMVHPWFAWWRHQMETFSALLAICAGNSPVPVNSPHKGQWRGALTFSLMCVWINGWVNNREAGDLRRYRVHYDVIVMVFHDIDM